MNTDFFYELLLCLASGFTQAVLLCLSIYMFRHHRNYLFQRIFAAVLVMHSFGFFNNFVMLACQKIGIKTKKVREVIKMLKNDGRYLAYINGDHRQLFFTRLSNIPHWLP